MSDRKLREQIAFRAARLLHENQESEYVHAKRRAARKLGLRFKVGDLPSNREVHDQLSHIAEVHEAALPEGDSRRLRIEALRVMRQLAGLNPTLIGDVASGNTVPGTVIELAVCQLEPDVVLARLPHGREDLEIVADRQSTGARSLIQIRGSHPVRLHLFDESAQSRVGLNAQQLAWVLESECPGIDLEKELQGLDPRNDRFEIYRELLEMLEDLSGDRDEQPGIALHHSLQVFDLALEKRSYDEEFLTAALMHEVGKAVSPYDCGEESVGLLEGLSTYRTLWLIENIPLGHQVITGECPAATRRELRAQEDFDDLLLLCELDRQACRPGIETSSISRAIELLRQLDTGEIFA